ncbi:MULTISPECIES: DUF2523 family protein [unclassified Pseudomonas]|uniref:DUF2523 family protein n=1 Tax=unclassified Pseudomonas TaxID=196821 RepID=UPI00244BA3ED|nr:MULTISPECIES: DUF2523 family protein [unclassified Pseudomonas]MDH0897723.1 DUF2523 family protein [Pseudomonas sp. GD03875]MDH1067876.1 DUF2523 family protein [Pseudomonas sp. GD03985]
MEWLAAFVDQVILFFQFIWDFLTTGIYDFVKDGLVLLTKSIMYSWVQVQIFALEIAYGAAREVMSDLGVSEGVRRRWGDIPADVANVLTFFGIPQALNIIFSALSTRFALKFVPFMGR